MYIHYVVLMINWGTDTYDFVLYMAWYVCIPNNAFGGVQEPSNDIDWLFC